MYVTVGYFPKNKCQMSAYCIITVVTGAAVNIFQSLIIWYIEFKWLLSVTLVTSHKTSHLRKHGQCRATQRNQTHDDVMCMVSWTVTRRRRWPHVLCCCFKQVNVGDFSLLFASKLSSRLDLHTSGMLIPSGQSVVTVFPSRECE